MNIDGSQTSNSSVFLPVRILFYVFLTGLVLFLTIWLSAVITIALLNLAQYIDGAVGTYLIDKGPGRLMRRVLLLLSIVVVFLALKKAGWRGWKDCGWSKVEDQFPDRRWIQFLGGIGIGFITLGSITVLTIFAGLYQLKALAGNDLHLTRSILLFPLAGLTVALVEETFCRGILFRVFARTWNTWAAALVTSLLFATIHFVEPHYGAFHGNSFLTISFNATMATLASIVPPAGSLFRFVNLVLFGLAFCALVARTKTIWMAVGAHAIWVAIIKFHAHITNFNAAFLSSLWLGKRTDFMDSLAATLIFIAMIFLALWNHKTAGRPVKIRGQLWHINPAETGKLDNFLKTGEELFATGNILKTYNGCRVVSQDALIFKKYWPKNFWNSLRFVFRPPRSKCAFLLADTLINHGLPTSPVLGWSASRRFGLLRSEAMIVSEIKNAEPLTAWLERKNHASEERLKVMAAYGDLMAAFHRHGYSNRDLKHENVMCSKNQPWLIWVVDLDGVRKCLFISRRRAVRDLIRVGKSLASLGWTDKTEIAAFFGAYNRQVPARLRRHSFPA